MQNPSQIGVALLRIPELLEELSAREDFGAFRVGQDPSDSKSNRLHVDHIFGFCFHSFEVYSIDSSQVIGKFLEVLNFNRLFLELHC